MIRRLVIDENDLILVVKENVVEQIDYHRGEMERGEFVNFLIEYQLSNFANNNDFVTREEFQQFLMLIQDILNLCQTLLCSLINQDSDNVPQMVNTLLSNVIDALNDFVEEKT